MPLVHLSLIILLKTSRTLKTSLLRRFYGSRGPSALPETSAANIPLRRAHRLQKITGKTKLQSQLEIDRAHMTPNQVAYGAPIKPRRSRRKTPFRQNSLAND
jgi:hypothetical protein